MTHSDVLTKAAVNQQQLPCDIQYRNSAAKNQALSGQFENFNVLIVDPPRKGLDVEVVTALLHSKTLTRLIYVSCGFKGFARDALTILASGCWKIVHAEGHVLFPGSDHIETLAIFDRKN